MRFKLIILFVLVILGPSLVAQEVQWMSLGEALSAQKIKPKKIKFKSKFQYKIHSEH